MKKFLLVTLAAAALTACGRDEKLSLEQVVLEKMQADTDLKDYKIEPQDMADCVIDEISQSLPVMPVDSRRGAYFEAYAKFISATNPLKAIEEATPLFGSAQEARKAAMSVTEYVISCMGRLMDRIPPDELNPPSKAPAPAAAPEKPAS